MAKSVLMAALGVLALTGTLGLGDGLSAAPLDSIGTADAKKIQESAMGTASSSDMQNATGGAVIDGVGTIPVGASVPDEKMQGLGNTQAVSTYAGTQEVVMKSCTTCHSAAPVCAELGKKDASQWAVTVQKMVDLGAELTASEQAAVVSYLAGEAPNSGPLCK